MHPYATGPQSFPSTISALGLFPPRAPHHDATPARDPPTPPATQRAHAHPPFLRRHPIRHPPPSARGPVISLPPPPSLPFLPFKYDLSQPRTTAANLTRKLRLVIRRTTCLAPPSSPENARGITSPPHTLNPRRFPFRIIGGGEWGIDSAPRSAGTRGFSSLHIKKKKHEAPNPLSWCVIGCKRMKVAMHAL